MPVGVLDFGDTCRSWLAAECAVLAVSLCGKRPSRVVQDVTELIRGFNSSLPLTEEEVAALPALMAARAALCAAGCEQQAVLEPDKGYAVEGALEAWGELDAITAVPDALMHAALRDACALPALRTPPVPRGGPLAEQLEEGAGPDGRSLASYRPSRPWRVARPGGAGGRPGRSGAGRGPLRRGAPGARRRPGARRARVRPPRRRPFPGRGHRRAARRCPAR